MRPCKFLLNTEEYAREIVRLGVVPISPAVLLTEACKSSCRPRQWTAVSVRSIIMHMYRYINILHSSLRRKVNRPRGYKTFFVLNSVEHEILNAHKYKNIKKFGIFKVHVSLECYFSRSYMLKCQQLLAF